jgi:RNA polymerase sigma factor (sigma-70 family)
MNVETDLVTQAQAGNREAMDEVLSNASSLVYRLAIRMLGDPEDARDASQEILMRIASGLGTYRGESAFRTWVYRVASNQLLTARKRRAEEATTSFDDVSSFLDASAAADLPAVEEQALLQEAKLTCNARMLLCLDRDHRLAYILGEILDLSSEEGADILEIGSDAFRKRLSRAREKMDDFTQARCGIVSPKNACRCGKVAALAVKSGKLTQLRWSTHAATAQKRMEIDELTSAVAMFRSHPDYAAPADLTRGVRELLNATTHAQTP